jgi:Na+-transporting NADH:ubiquinone oxidoreductase subunit A
MMKTGSGLVLLCTFFLFSASPLLAQSNTSSAGNFLLYGLLAAGVLLLFAAVVRVSDNMLVMESRRLGVEQEGVNYGVFPDEQELFPADKPAYVGKSGVKTLKGGHNLNLEGEASGPVQDAAVSTFAVQPADFIGISPLPKLEVEVGAQVKAGDSIFFDKNCPELKYVAPVSGEVIAVNRGEKRAIQEVVILADKKLQYRVFDAIPDLDKAERQEIVDFLCASGAWTHLRQRPYNMVADPKVIPVNIFISTFDTGPMAPDLNVVVAGRDLAFHAGIKVLKRLTEGQVFLGLNAGGASSPSQVFTSAPGAALAWFKGKHPTGNVGVQIHHLSPVRPGQKVWTLGVQDVITIGALFTEKRYNAERVVALTGSELNAPAYVRTYLGANLGDLLKNNLKEGNNRIISGDALSGKAKTAANFLGTYDDQVTVLPEGDDYDLFGWLMPSKAIPSASKTYLTTLFPDLKYKPDTNTRGEKRAFVVTGQYEGLLPMDVYPQHLLKAVITNDVERMQGLGIHELVEEDLALCEFACTSKQPLQQILRQGIELMQKEGL